MKRLHLICNAHLDPVWMWDIDEGKAAALATFRSAVKLAGEFDYIFCHNEALLYEYVEKYDMPLFEQIKELVRQNKWHIMGGWYVQPDCRLPLGESFMRQIKAGNEYFFEKFGVKPTVAVNFDSFGHSRGLVQILKANGYDSYLFCRPMPNLKELPSDQFNWVGYDSISRIKCCRIADDFMYCSDLLHAVEFIEKKAAAWNEYDTGIALWGVGNHGGGPSRKDLTDINALMAEKQNYEIIHSTPERFFAEVNPTADYADSLSCLVGCYSSMSSIKKAHIELEDKLYMTEKMCAVAELCGKNVWDKDAFSEAEKMLLTVQFHDILGGTVAQNGEKTALQYVNRGLYLLNEMRDKAFFALLENEKAPPAGTYPIYVYNPSFYERETVIEAEFLILDILISDDIENEINVFCDGKPVVCQVIKELSNINYDRRKRIAFKAKLKPTAITCFDVFVNKHSKTKKVPIPDGDIVLSDSIKEIKINKKTGLIDSFKLGGREYLSGGAFEPVIYDDNCDPWGWTFDKIGKNPVVAVPDTGNRGMFGDFESVHIIENGDIFTETESFFTANDSKFRIAYKVYKDLPYIDITCDVFWNERQKTLKLKIPTAINGEFTVQSIFGTDTFEQNGFEQPGHRFAAITDKEDSISVFNNCCYGVSAENGEIYLTLLRGVAYCAHPILDRPLIDGTRYIPFVEQGKSTFTFRLAVCKADENTALATEFCEPPYALNAYPDGNGQTVSSVKINCKEVVIAALYIDNGKTVVRLHNSTKKAKKCVLSLGTKEYPLSFGPFEIKTLTV